MRSTAVPERPAVKFGEPTCTAAMDYFPLPIGQLRGCLASTVLFVGAAWAAGAVMSAVPVAAAAAALRESTLRLEIPIPESYVFGRMRYNTLRRV